MSPVRHGADRFTQQQIGIPLWDAVYQSCWPGTAIERELGELDRQLGADLSIRPASGMRRLLQEKTLSFEYARFATLTVEYEQVAHGAKDGDWFHLAVHAYACGYLTQQEDALSPWIIADWSRIIEATERGLLQWRGNQNRDGRARASFRYAYMRDLHGAGCSMYCGAHPSGCQSA